MEIVENNKGFKVIKMTLMEVQEKLGGLGICDHCNSAALEGYYIAVLNYWVCRGCYERWISYAKRYDEDIPFENRNFELVKRIFE